MCLCNDSRQTSCKVLLAVYRLSVRLISHGWLLDVGDHHDESSG